MEKASKMITIAEEKIYSPPKRKALTLQENYTTFITN